jgi:hypothetical protein
VVVVDVAVLVIVAVRTMVGFDATGADDVVLTKVFVRVLDAVPVALPESVYVSVTVAAIAREPVAVVVNVSVCVPVVVTVSSTDAVAETLAVAVCVALAVATWVVL